MEKEPGKKDVFNIAPKANKEALMRWRKATLALNAARRFRYTTKFVEGLGKGREITEVDKYAKKLHKFRKTGHAVMAINRFKTAGERAKLYQLDEEDDFSGKVYLVSLQELTALNGEANMKALEMHGGLRGLSKSLSVNPQVGIRGSDQDLAKRREAFGENRYPEKAGKSFWSFLWDACQDTTLIILMVCGVISLVAGMVQDVASGWYDGAGIGFAVILVVLVTGISDYRQSLQFRDLSAEKANIQLKVMRNGRMTSVSIFDLVVGDVVPLHIGDQVPGDSVVISSQSLVIDESSMTGESQPKRKDSQHPFLLSGCKVVDGFGSVMITGVGTNTEWGRIMATLSEDDNEETPLQVRLNGVATSIGLVGLGVAVLVFIILIVRYFVDYKHKGASKVIKDVVDIFSIAVTIIVVAVPEGLPLAVTLTLAYSMRKMMNDKALVRHLAACETMGSATTICSDKTGTLTMNKMVVVKSWTLGALEDDTDITRISPRTKQILFDAVAQNSMASVYVPKDGTATEVTASPTETALINWGLKMGMDFNAAKAESEILTLEAFNSTKKRAGVATRLADDLQVVHWKGAAEMILANCTHTADQNGELRQFTAEGKEQMQKLLDDMAGASLRCIAFGYRPLAATEVCEDRSKWELPENDLILLAIVGIKDPCRPGVPEAVARCQAAGVKVRMVTGDNPKTAQAIAGECGILTPSGVIIEGKDFRVLSEEEMLAVIPNIDVMARSSPTDKHLLVKMLRQMGEVVAVTGDGTNDAPALHEADIGLAMGIAGTEVAKESSDIVILDDNFQSIVKVVRWGRSVYANIQKFIQFQLTVNIVALTVNFVAACAGGTVPLTAVQLLWVNLVMDTLGALALATEQPTDDLMEQAPGLYQLALFLTFQFDGIAIWKLQNYPDPVLTNNTIIFNTFVFCQVFNEINSRRLNQFNVFSGIFTNRLFCIVIAISVVFQIVIVEFLRNFASTTKLTLEQWAINIALGAVVLPIGALLKFIPVPKTPLLEFLPNIRRPWGGRHPSPPVHTTEMSAMSPSEPQDSLASSDSLRRSRVGAEAV